MFVARERDAWLRSGVLLAAILPVTLEATVSHLSPVRAIFRGVPMIDQDLRNNGRSVAIAMAMTAMVVGTALAVAFR